MTHHHPLQLDGFVPLLQVYDMTSSLQFYRDLLGFSIHSSSGEGDDVDWVLLQRNEMQLMLNTLYEKELRPAYRDGNREALHEDIILYFGCPDIDGAYGYLKDNFIKLDPPMITGYGWKAINLKDPDGYAICFHCPMENEEHSN